MKNKKTGRFESYLKDIKCPICKKVFHPRTKYIKFCSKECGYKNRRGKKQSKEAIEKRSKALKGIPRTKEWRKKMSIAMVGNNNGVGNKGKKRPDLAGKKHPGWKGGYWINNGGYKVLESVYTNGRRIQEHRYVMEKHLGRKLKKEEHIHHINGNKLDNRIENLQIVSNSEHYYIHHPEYVK